MNPPATTASANPHRMAVEEFENLYEMAVAQFRRAADIMELPTRLRRILSELRPSSTTSTRSAVVRRSEQFRLGRGIAS